MDTDGTAGRASTVGRSIILAWKKLFEFLIPLTMPNKEHEWTMIS